MGDAPIEEADLRLHGPEKTLMQQMTEEIQELRKRTKPLKEIDPMADHIINDTTLRRIVEKMLKKRAYLQKIEGYIDGLEERISIYSVLGGTPSYLLEFSKNLDNTIANIVGKRNFLYSEPEFVLR